eukprot:1947462-Rhodomonas_salina.1
MALPISRRDVCNQHSAMSGTYTAPTVLRITYAISGTDTEPRGTRKLSGAEYQPAVFASSLTGESYGEIAGAYGMWGSEIGQVHGCGDRGGTWDVDSEIP